jgi:hypothetical protein
LKIEIHGIRIRCPLGSTGFGQNELGVERVRESRDDFVLHVEEVGDRLVEAIRPQVIAAFRVD